MPLTLYHLRRLHTSMNRSNTQNIPHQIIYHHLLICVNSPLVPRDRSLTHTVDNAIYSLTITHPLAPIIRLYQLYLFLNPYKREPYLLYTFAGGQHNNHTVDAQHIIITTSLPSSIIPSKRP